MATLVEGALESKIYIEDFGDEELNALEILACVVTSYEAKLPSIKKQKTKTEILEPSTIWKVKTDHEQHRVSCHRCGNIRKRKFICTRPNCPHIFCGRCAEKMEEDYGLDVFEGGCPVCRELCCCSNKTLYCNRKNHCYRKCPLSKQRAEEKSEKQECGKEVVCYSSMLSLDEHSGTKDSSPGNIPLCVTPAARKRVNMKAESSPTPAVPICDRDDLGSYQTAILQSQLYNNHYAQRSQAMRQMNPLLGLGMSQLLSGNLHIDNNSCVSSYPFPNNINSQQFLLNTIQEQQSKSQNTFSNDSASTSSHFTIPEVPVRNSITSTRPAILAALCVDSTLSTEETTSSDKSDDTLTSSTAAIQAQHKYKTLKFTPLSSVTAKSLAADGTLSTISTPNYPANLFDDVHNSINNLGCTIQPLYCNSNHHCNSMNHMMLNMPSVPLQMYNPETLRNYQQLISQAFSPFNSLYYAPYMQYNNFMPSIDPNKIDQQPNQYHFHQLHQSHQAQIQNNSSYNNC